MSVNAPIAILLEEGEDISSLKVDNPSPVSNNSKSSQIPPEKIEAAVEKDVSIISDIIASGGDATNPRNLPASLSTKKDDDRIKASPLARRMAMHAELDLAQIAGVAPMAELLRPILTNCYQMVRVRRLSGASRL